MNPIGWKEMSIHRNREALADSLSVILLTPARSRPSGSESRIELYSQTS